MPTNIKPRKGASPKKPSSTDPHSIPALQAVFAGSPPAISTPVKNEDPLIRAIWDAREQLGTEGIAFYKSLQGDTGVVFNSLQIHPEQLKQADQQGQLLAVAPLYTEINKLIKENPAGHPLLSSQPPEGVPQPPADAIPPAGAGAVTSSAPDSVLRRIQGDRVDSVLPSGPTSGTRPGAGRVLNSLIKNAV